MVNACTVSMNVFVVGDIDERYDTDAGVKMRVDTFGCDILGTKY